MNNKKICFILCVNNTLYERECLHYISCLRIPEGYEVEQISVKDARSMAAGYNEAMKQTDAKYKVYLHQDVFLINKNFVFDMLSVFTDPKIGMFGMVGVLQMPQNGVMWTGDCVGRIFAHPISDAGEAIFGQVTTDYQPVEAIDGHCMITQYDIPWREDLFQGWDYYDAAQSMEFRRRGYQVVVPRMKESWCIHDDGMSNLDKYFDWREVFFTEYGNMLRDNEL